MTNLTPELRADKNGKLVTRHIRPDAKTSSMHSFPSPVSMVKPTTSDDLQKVESMLVYVLNEAIQKVSPEVVSDADSSEHEDDDFWSVEDDDQDPEDLGWEPQAMLAPSSISNALNKLPERTISRMHEMMESRPYTDDYEVALIHVLSYENDAQLIEYMTHFYDQLSDFFPDRDVFGDPDVNSYTLARDYMQGLRNYESVGYKLPEDINEATEEDLTVMEALHLLNTELGDDEGNGDPALGRIAIDHPHDVQQIIDIVEERDTRDPIVIREIIESKTPSIRSGLL